MHEHTECTFGGCYASYEECSLVLIVMGVVGSGKTTVGKLLAEKLAWHFADADDFHSSDSVKKIRKGIPLTDLDRAPWLSALHTAIEQWNSAQRNVILACSALKRSYRDKLRAGPVQFVYLKGGYDLIRNRLGSRHGHFASESILASQFADLEEPNDAITVFVDKTPAAIFEEIMARLKLLQ